MLYILNSAFTDVETKATELRSFFGNVLSSKAQRSARTGTVGISSVLQLSSLQLTN